MVGPWLFWLGPMISRELSVSFTFWHGIAILLSLSGIAMTSHDGSLVAFW